MATRTIKNGTKLNLTDFTYTEVIEHFVAMTHGTKLTNVELAKDGNTFKFSLIKFVDPADETTRYAVSYNFRNTNHAVEFVWDHSTMDEANTHARQIMKNTTGLVWPELP